MIKHNNPYETIDMPDLNGSVWITQDQSLSLFVVSTEYGESEYAIWEDVLVVGGIRRKAGYTNRDTVYQLFIQTKMGSGDMWRLLININPYQANYNWLKYINLGDRERMLQRLFFYRKAEGEVIQLDNLDFCDAMKCRTPYINDILRKGIEWSSWMED